MGIYILVLFSFFASFLSVGVSPVEARTIVVVSGSDFPVSSLTAEEASHIFLGEKTMLGGVRLQPLDNSDGQLREQFFTTVLKMGGDDFNTHWIAKNFQDGLKVPEPVSSGALSNKVKEKGRLGFMDASEAKDSGLRTLLSVDTK